MAKWANIVALVTIGVVGVATASATFAQQGGDGRADRHERPAFADLDADGDGFVTAAEIEAHAAARLGAFDADGDGALSRDEIVAMITEQARLRAETMADRLIAWQDADDDGVLSFDEVPQGRMVQMAQRLDSDGDGAISEEEYEAMKDRGRGGRHGKGPRGRN